MKSLDLYKKNTFRTITVGVLVTLFFVCIVSYYYNTVYEEKRSNIIKDGKMAASSAAQQFDRYLSTNTDLIKFTAYTLDEMIRDKRTDEEISDYLVGQSTAIKNAVLENSTGLYGYINGRFFSGTGWTPPEGYVATERPWYTKPMESPGQLTILEPYVDVQSGNTMLALGKTLCDGVSVISVDVSLDQMQKMTEAAVDAAGYDVEMILTDEGTVVTHSDNGEVGKNYNDPGASLGSEVFRLLNSSGGNYFELDHEWKHYIVYDAVFEGGWHCVSVHDATTEFASLRQIFVGTVFVVVVMVLILASMLVVSNKRAAIASRALAANEEISMADISGSGRTLSALPGEKQPEEKSREELARERLLPLEGFDAINTNEGINYSGSALAYMPLLKNFYNSIGRRAEELELCYGKGDMGGYKKCIRSVKSSARIIGAAHLAGRAQELEKACDNADNVFWDEHHMDFIREYRSFEKPLAEVVVKG